MIRCTLRTLRTAAALALLATPLAAQKNGDSDGPMSLNTTVAQPLRVVYRTALEAAREKGYEFRALVLDQLILTLPHQGEKGKPAAMVQVELEPRGDSTAFAVAAVGLNAAGDARCSGPDCMAAELMASMDLTQAITDRLKAWTPPAPSRGDSLFAAKAFGYSPENPVKVGGGAESGVANEHAWLDSLRGPNGEPTTWFRIGSCCTFLTPNAPADMQGHGALDAYEVTVQGQSRPVLLYVNMYDPPTSQTLPEGFTRPGADRPAS
jgi:hypothetical protein